MLDFFGNESAPQTPGAYFERHGCPRDFGFDVYQIRTPRPALMIIRFAHRVSADRALAANLAPSRHIEPAFFERKANHNRK
jgi:hypothetical protein